MKKGTLNRGNLRDLIIALCLVSAYFFPVNKVQIGIALALLAMGTVLHVVTKATLVRNRVLCTEGVYQICRHPYYLANFIVDISLCLLSGNVYLVLAYPFLFFGAYGPTFQFEEEKLAGLFGQSFFDFTIKTPQVFPHPESLIGLGQILKEISLSRVTRKEWIRIMRFWGVALLLPMVHAVTVGGIGILSFKNVDYPGTLALTLLAIILLVASLTLRLIPNKPF